MQEVGRSSVTPIGKIHGKIRGRRRQAGVVAGILKMLSHERRVQLLLTGVTPPRRSRVRAAAAVAAADSGPIGTTGFYRVGGTGRCIGLHVSA